MSFGLSVALGFVAIALLSSPGAASGPGMHGRVFALDADGDIVGVVSGAEIVLTDQAGGNAGTAISDTTVFLQD